jgi:DNA-binding response OmpR family regulator
MTNSLRVLIVEDNRDLVIEMTDFLTAGGMTVDSAVDGITGLHLAIVNDYDAIILDLMLPGMDGMMLFNKLRNEAEKNTPVLMLTARDSLEEKVSGLDAGADDYLVKPAELREVEARVRALARRGAGQLSKKKLQVGDLVLDLDSHCAFRLASRIELPPIPYQILELLMLRYPRPVSREDIEHLIWGEGRADSGVLRAHMHLLRTLIDKPFEKPMLNTIWGIGYQLLSGNEAGE